MAKSAALWVNILIYGYKGAPTYVEGTHDDKGVDRMHCAIRLSAEPGLYAYIGNESPANI